MKTNPVILYQWQYYALRVPLTLLARAHKGVACPGVTHMNRAFLTPYLCYTPSIFFRQTFLWNVQVKSFLQCFFLINVDFLSEFWITRIEQNIISLGLNIDSKRILPNSVAIILKVCYNLLIKYHVHITIIDTE